MNRAVRIDPKCRFPVGEGANRVLAGVEGRVGVELDENWRVDVFEERCRQRKHTYSMRTRIAEEDQLVCHERNRSPWL